MKRFEIMDGPLNGTHLLEASAGTGKTYTIADLYLRLVLEKELMVDRILVVTFTVAATGELRERLRLKLKAAAEILSGRPAPGGESIPGALESRFYGQRDAIRRLRQALYFFDAAAVYTIHGFCRRVLLENAFESGHLFDTELAADQAGVIREVVEDFWRISFYEGHPLLYRYGMKYFSAEGLIPLVRLYMDNPGLHVIPRPTSFDAGEIELRLGEARTLFGEMRGLWKKEGKAVAGLYSSMVEEGKLKGDSYKKSQTAGRLKKLEEFLEGGDFSADFNQLQYFTRSRLLREARDAEYLAHHRFFDLCDGLYNLLERVQSTFADYLVNFKFSLFAYAGDEIARRKRLKNTRSFSDLTAGLHRALQGPGGELLAAAVSGRYPAALIDEFQDTDTIQYEIFTRIFDRPGCLMYLIGDPKQAIYRFRGADIYAYMQAARESSSRATLGLNWRSVPELVSAVNTVFMEVNKNPFVFSDELIGFPPVDPAPHEVAGLRCDEIDPAPMQLWHLPLSAAGGGKKRIPVPEAESCIAKAVAGEISRLVSLGAKGSAVIGEKPLAPGDIAVLVRKRYQAEIVHRELARMGIPGVLYGTDSVYSTVEASELQRVMTAVADTGYGSRVRTALGTGIFGWTGERIFRLMNDDTPGEPVMERFARYRELWHTRGFIGMFRELLREEDVHRRLLAAPGGERKITNLLHLAEMLHRQESEKRPGMEALIAWLEGKRGSAEERNEEEELRLETDEQAVKLVTLHRSKGLQYPVVFCPFLWGGIKTDREKLTFHGRDPDDGPVERLILDLGSADIGLHQKKADLEELAESVRLMYVGLTRARCRLYLAWGLINTADISAPAYVFHRPPEVDEKTAVDMLADRMGRMDEPAILNELRRLEKNSEGAVRVSALPGAGGVPFAHSVPGTGRLVCREFTGRISRDRCISSYSSLSAGSMRAEDERDHDRDIMAPPAVTPGDGLSRFPAGTAAGIFFHDLLEELDYTRTEDDYLAEVIGTKLERYGYGPGWLEDIASMVRRVLNVPLNPDGRLTLGGIRTEERLNEMEFYFPLEALAPEGLKKVFRAHGRGEAEGLPRSIEGLEFSPCRGFMRGFIDLVFRWEGKYFIVDWKSNLLGGNPDSYLGEKLRAVMEQHRYDLQYHLYTVALHRYLRSRIRDYSYEKHFGGVYYLFLRGIDPVAGMQRGIYYDRPGESLVYGLSGLFSGEGA